MFFLYAILVSTNIRNKCTGFFTQIINKGVLEEENHGKSKRNSEKSTI